MKTSESRDLSKLTQRQAWRGFTLTTSHIETPEGHCIDPSTLRVLAAIAIERRTFSIELRHALEETGRLRLRLMQLERALLNGIHFKLPDRPHRLPGCY